MILLSPSKTQDFLTPSPTKRSKKLIFPNETEQLSKVLKKLSKKELAELMHVSPKLAELTYGRFKNWNGNFSSKDSGYKQALFAFKGDVYKAFDDEKYTADDISYMEKNIKIISGFYGLLTPLTNIKPYRLEMGTKLSFKVGVHEYKSLYQYWREVLTAKLMKEMQGDELLINLASVEYSKAIDLKQFGERVVNIQFKVSKNGVPKTVAIFAKRQRGQMAYWVTKNRVETVAGLKKYRNDGFAFSKDLSSNNNLVFVKKA